MNTIRGVIKCFRISKHPIDDLNGNWFLSFFKEHRHGFSYGGMSAVLTQNIAASLVLPYKSELEEDLNGVELLLYDHDMMNEWCTIETFYDHKSKEHKYTLCEIEITEIVVTKKVEIDVDRLQPISVPKSVFLPKVIRTDDLKLEVPPVGIHNPAIVDMVLGMQANIKKNKISEASDPILNNSTEIVENIDYNEAIQKAYEKSSWEMWNAPEDETYIEDDARDESEIEN